PRRPRYCPFRHPELEPRPCKEAWRGRFTFREGFRTPTHKATHQRELRQLEENRGPEKCLGQSSRSEERQGIQAPLPAQRRRPNLPRANLPTPTNSRNIKLG